MTDFNWESAFEDTTGVVVPAIRKEVVDSIAAGVVEACSPMSASRVEEFELELDSIAGLKEKLSLVSAQYMRAAEKKAELRKHKILVLSPAADEAKVAAKQEFNKQYLLAKNAEKVTEKQAEASALASPTLIPLQEKERSTLQVLQINDIEIDLLIDTMHAIDLQSRTVRVLLNDTDSEKRFS